MAEASPATAPASGVTFSDLVKSVSSRGDIFMALGVITILVVLILPLPRWLMDVSLAFSISFSVLILLTALFVDKPLQFNAFPTVLLLATMVRLSLNLASTRLILSHGHEGTGAAGRVIEAFGGFVMGGNFVIGIIVFANPGHRQLHRHHQGRQPHRRGLCPLYPRRHARQADGHRCRSVDRTYRRGRGPPAAPGPGGRKQLLRLHGRRRQVRARRRHRRPPDHLHKHRRRHNHRRRTEGLELRPGGGYLHPADRRRRSGDADSGPHRVHRRRLVVTKAGVRGAMDKALFGQLRRATEGARLVFLPARLPGPAAGHPGLPLPHALVRDRRHRLAREQGTEKG